jgi:NAD(P)-dependent dehydrogenase (short-subunit alcohol dehydrogenase family)
MDDLQGRVAVVTGAAGGIGLALAGQLAGEGVRVVMSDVDAERLEEAAATVDGEVEPVAADVSRPGDVDALAARATERFGAVSILCNNAGVTRPGPAWELGLDEWQWLLSVNVLGVVHGIRAFVPAMLERGQPAHVVNTASIGGLLPYAGIAAYTASKYAVVGLSESLQLDLQAIGAPIGVSVLCPGPTETDFRTHSRALHPSGPAEEVEGEYEGVARIPASDAAALVVDAIRSNRFWVLTHPAYRDALERRTRGIVETDDVVAGDFR